MTELSVPVVKGKTSVSIDTEKLPDAVYAEALMLGLKVLVNRGASKISKVTYPDETELKAAAQAAAEKQVEAIMAGKIKFTGQKAAKGTSGAVMTEARRLARNLVKDAIKRDGKKISHYEASEITKAANALIAEDPTILEQAKANLEERAKVPVKIAVSAIPTSAKRIAEAEAKKAKAKGTLSAKQAGKVAPRQKGQQPQART